MPYRRVRNYLTTTIRLDYIQPGNQQQNAYIERYNRTVRYDWLSHYLFESIDEVQNYAADWMWTYNHARPHMALGVHHPETEVSVTRLYFWRLLKLGGLPVYAGMTAVCNQYPNILAP